jgi:DNA-binding NtrC family response regulator
MADLLVVDDDALVAGTVADILMDEGHTVRTARNGAEGLWLLSERLPDVIVLDVEMPQLSGPDMARQMMIENVGRERIPIVLLSGAVNLGRTAALLGTPYALEKPCKLDALLETTQRALTERRAPSPQPPASGGCPAWVDVKR